VKVGTVVLKGMPSVGLMLVAVVMVLLMTVLCPPSSLTVITLGEMGLASTPNQGLASVNIIADGVARIVAG
jgi:hypothetical protein